MENTKNTSPAANAIIWVATPAGAKRMQLSQNEFNKLQAEARAQRVHVEQVAVHSFKIAA